MKSINCETLNQPVKQVQGMVQGDKIAVTTSSLKGGSFGSSQPIKKGEDASSPFFQTTTNAVIIIYPSHLRNRRPPHPPGLSWDLLELRHLLLALLLHPPPWLGKLWHTWPLRAYERNG